MKKDLRFLLCEPFDGLRKETVDELENVVKDFSLSFISFLRENYSTSERWESIFLENNIWRCYDTDKKYTAEELYTIFIESYEK